MSGGYKRADTFKGFESWWHRLQMTAKMHMHIFLILALAHMLIVFLYLFLFQDRLFSLLLTAVSSFQFAYIPTILKILFQKALIVFVLATPVWLLYPLLFGVFKKKSKEIMSDKHLRGSQIMTEQQVNKELQKKYSISEKNIKLGKVYVPVELETEHFLILGRTGQGKTTMLNQVIDKIRQRKKKAIVYDCKGDYISTFYDERKDYILNVRDARCMNFSIFADIESTIDIDSIAASLIPLTFTDDDFWRQHARGIFSSIIYYLMKTNRATNENLYYYCSMKAQELEQELGQAVENFGLDYCRRGLAALAEVKNAGDISATMKQFTDCFYYAAHLENDFSIKKWIETADDSFIFLVNYADQRDTMKPFLSMFIDVAMKHILTMQNDYDRRIFFIIDEFASLQRLSSLVMGLEQGRSKGLSLWLAMQDTNQLETIYRKTAYTIANNSNLVCFNLQDPESQRFAANVFGEQEILETDETLSMGLADLRDGLNITRKRKVDKLILPSELGQLDKFEFYLKLSKYITKSRADLIKYRQVAPSFIDNGLFAVK